MLNNTDLERVTMDIRLANIEDIYCIMDIFSQARKYIASCNFDQWQDDNYPDINIIKSDISKKSGYVIYQEDNIAGYMAFLFEQEPTYNKIEQGKWESEFEYAVIHRLAIADNYRGKNLSSIFFDFAENKCKEKKVRSLRIDTHKQNEPMKKILKNRKYKYCGIITLEDLDKRNAYEKLIIPFLVDDSIVLRKKHPCGCDLFNIKRIGMDFRLECDNCKSQIWLSRSDVQKRLKKRI